MHTTTRTLPMDLNVGDTIIVGGDLREVLESPRVFMGEAIVRCRRYVPDMPGSEYVGNLHIRRDYAVTRIVA